MSGTYTEKWNLPVWNANPLADTTKLMPEGVSTPVQHPQCDLCESRGKLSYKVVIWGVLTITTYAFDEASLIY